MDMQDGLDAAGAEVVKHAPTGDQAVSDAIKEVVAAEKDAEAAAAAEKVAAKEAKAAAKEAEAEPTPEEEKDPQAVIDEADKQEAKDKEAKEKEAKEKESAEAAQKEALKRRDLEAAERMSKLVLQEKRLRAKEDEYKKQVAAAEAKAKTVEAEVAKYKAIEALLETNPARAYKLMGKDFNKGAQRALALLKDPGLSIQDELEATRSEFSKRLDAEKAEREKERAEYQSRQQAQMEEKDRADTAAFVASHVTKAGEKYELVKAEGLEQQVAKELYDHWKATGDMIPIDDYLGHVEAELEKKIERYAQTSKAKKALTPKITAAVVKAKEEAAKAAAAEDEDDKETDDEPVAKTIKRVKRTLSNSVGSRVSAGPKKIVSSGDPWKDARAEALALLDGD